jgi:superfamily II DNA or RNA helicase
LLDFQEAAVSLAAVVKELPNLPHYRLVVLDESHNLRNREGRRYRAIREYIERNESRVLLLKARGFEGLAVVTNGTADPVALARRFSPSTNGGLRSGETELRVLIATDVLAEGQNLQDAHLIVNFDLPWAIIRLIRRAGRVDRIGQKHDTITVYSFLPADGVERIIGLRQRLFHRL